MIFIMISLKRRIFYEHFKHREYNQRKEKRKEKRKKVELSYAFFRTFIRLLRQKNKFLLHNDILQAIIMY